MCFTPNNLREYLLVSQPLPDCITFWGVRGKYHIMLMMYWVCQKDGSLLIIIHFSSHVKILAISSSRVNYSSYRLLCMKLWQNNNSFIVCCDFLGWKSGQRSVGWFFCPTWCGQISSSGIIMVNGPKGPKQLHSKVWFLGRKGSSVDVGSLRLHALPIWGWGLQIWIFQQTIFQKYEMSSSMSPTSSQSAWILKIKLNTSLYESRSWEATSAVELSRAAVTWVVSQINP